MAMLILKSAIVSWDIQDGVGIIDIGRLFAAGEAGFMSIGVTMMIFVMLVNRNPQVNGHLAEH